MKTSTKLTLIQRQRNSPDELDQYSIKTAIINKVNCEVN